MTQESYVNSRRMHVGEGAASKALAREMLDAQQGEPMESRVGIIRRHGGAGCGQSSKSSRRAPASYGGITSVRGHQSPA